MQVSWIPCSFGSVSNQKPPFGAKTKMNTETKEAAYTRQDHIRQYKTLTVVIHVPLDGDKLSLDYRFCDATGELFPSDDLAVDTVSDHSRCDACWNRVGRSEQELVAAGVPA